MTALTAILLWLLVLFLVASLVRRLTWLPGVIVALGLAVLIWQLWQAPDSGPVDIFGQTIDFTRSSTFFGFVLQLNDQARGAAIVLFYWGVLFALTSAWIQTDRVLAPTIPLILAALLLAVSAEPLLWAPLWLVVAAILMAFPAQGASPRLARAALRTLIAPALALPFFLFTAWVLNQPAIAADDPALWISAWRSLVVGVALLLTPAPLHGWITAQGETAPPLTAAFLVGVWQITVYVLIRHLLLTYPPLADYADPARWLPWLAVIQLLWAGVFTFGSNRLGQLWGYLLLWDFGAAFLLWSITGELGTQAMIWLFLTRPLVLILFASALRSLTTRFGENASYSAVGGAGERLPIATIGVVAGGLFILGWPLGALFPSRISTLRLVEANSDSLFVSYGLIFIWAMAAIFLASLGVIRLLRALSQPLTTTDLPRENLRLSWLILPLLLIGFLLSLNPALIESFTRQITDWLTRL